MARSGVPLVTFDPTVTIDERRAHPYAGTNQDMDDSASDDGGDGTGRRKRWTDYIPLCVTVALIALPHPSLLRVLVRLHLLVYQAPATFLVHLAALYTLTFAAISYLIICAARDPGPVPLPKVKDADAEGGDVNLRDALLGPEEEEDDFLLPGRWCRMCWAPKPPRTHHCSSCGRCILKMDHHCPWIGAKCVGHRTYPAFVLFLGSVTLLALYIAVLAIHSLIFAFQYPLALDTQTPLHMLFLAFLGVVFGLVIGSFFGYHVYLVLTNQTTIENISPFLLLRLLPSLPSTCRLSSPPTEPELTYAQRRAVRAAHHAGVRPYDLGSWRRNAASVFGSRPARWVRACAIGDGRTWERNVKAEERLAKLAAELVRLEEADEEARARAGL